MDNTKCRLCLNQLGMMKDIFEHKMDCQESLSDFLYWVFRVEVDTLDPYSKLICDDCLARIQYVINWRNKFQANQKYLESNYSKIAQVDQGTSSSKNMLNKTTTDESSTNKKSAARELKGKVNQQSQSMDELVGQITNMFNPNKLEKQDEDINWSQYLYKKDVSTQTEKALQAFLAKKFGNVHHDPMCLMNAQMIIGSHSEDRVRVSLDCLKLMSPRIVVQDIGQGVVEGFKRLNTRTYKKINGSEKRTNEGYIKVKENVMELLSPRVYLDDLDSVIESENYEQLNNKQYRKRTSHSATRKNNKKRCKYIEYYYNHQSSAIRELITSKGLEGCSDISDKFDMNSIETFSCRTCGEQCGSQLDLDIHTIKAHKPVQCNIKGPIRKIKNHKSSKKKKLPNKLIRAITSNKFVRTATHAVINVSRENGSPQKTESFKMISNSHLTDVIKKLADRLTEEVKLV